LQAEHAQWPSFVWAGTVAAVLFAEAIMLHLGAATRIAPYLPLWADQVQYLMETYRGYGFIHEHGLLAGTVEAVRQPRPQGWLLQTVASLAMTVVGPGRMAALDINLALLLGWLGVTAWAIKRAFGAAASILALGLMALPMTTILNPGGVFDFRLDYASTCLWGMIVVLTAVADGREGWPLRLAVLILGTVLILTRFISASYLLPFGGGVVFMSLLPWFRSARWGRRLLWWLLAAIAVWLLIFAVITVANFDLISSYYIRGHLTGEERLVRRAYEKLFTFWDDLRFYPRVIYVEHLGRALLAMVGLSLLAGLALRLLGHRRTDEKAPAPDRPERDGDRRLRWYLAVVIVGLAVPFAVLTANLVKSSAVAGILVPPLVLVIVGVVLRLFRCARGQWSRRSSRVLQALAALAVVVALVSQWRRVHSEIPRLPPQPVLESLTRLVDDAIPYVREAGGRPVVWSLDGHHTEVSSSTVQVFMFERTCEWINLTGGMGYGALEQRLDAAEIHRGLEASDVLILSEYPPGTKMGNPSDESVREQHGLLERYAAEHLQRIGDYDADDRTYTLYVRPGGPAVR
jgi:hypothetical protein